MEHNYFIYGFTLGIILFLIIYKLLVRKIKRLNNTIDKIKYQLANSTGRVASLEKKCKRLKEINNDYESQVIKNEILINELKNELKIICQKENKIPNNDPESEKIELKNESQYPNTIFKEHHLNLMSGISNTEGYVNFEYDKLIPKASLVDIYKLASLTFVDYDINEFPNNNEYPIIKIPKKDCVIRSYRREGVAMRGYKELEFENAIRKVFHTHFEVLGDVRIHTGAHTRAFEPDIALIEKSGFTNLRIDVEIDEPYASNGLPIHYKGFDDFRDLYFIQRGWVVIRFTEKQVHEQEKGCIQILADFLNQIDKRYYFDFEGSTLVKEKCWDMLQSQKWVHEKYREKYLNHEFDNLPAQYEKGGKGISLDEEYEEKQVSIAPFSSPITRKEKNYNKRNEHPRDQRVCFYPSPHIYTIDGVYVKSVSTITSLFFPDFDTIKFADLKANDLGLSPDQIIAKWEKDRIQAANDGTKLHLEIEDYFLNGTLSNSIEFKMFRNFINDHTLNAYRTEWRIFEEDYNIAGTADYINFYNGIYELYDWKRSKKIIDSEGYPIKINNWQKGLGVLSKIDDTSFNRYCIQQNIYRLILKNKYDIELSKMHLVVLHPLYQNYVKIEVPIDETTAKCVLDNYNILK